MTCLPEMMVPSDGPRFSGPHSTECQPTQLPTPAIHHPTQTSHSDYVTSSKLSQPMAPCIVASYSVHLGESATVHPVGAVGLIKWAWIAYMYCVGIGFIQLRRAVVDATLPPLIRPPLEKVDYARHLNRRHTYNKQAQQTNPHSTCLSHLSRRTPIGHSVDCTV